MHKHMPHWLFLFVVSAVACSAAASCNSSDDSADIRDGDTADVSWDTSPAEDADAVLGDAEAVDSVSSEPDTGEIQPDRTSSDVDDRGEEQVACGHSPFGPAPSEPRTSSFQDCTFEHMLACDFDEVCDYTRYDIPCDTEPCEDPEQTGDQRCHRRCTADPCARGERCVERPVYISDTTTAYDSMCLCDGESCPVRGPGGEARPAEGGLAHWRAEADLPIDVFDHATAVSADTLYISGGVTWAHLSPDGTLATSELIDEVYAAPLNDDGVVGTWEPATDLRQPLRNHAMVVLNGRLYVAGGEGIEQRNFVRTVYSAAIDGDMGLGTWRTERSLPLGRAHHSLLTDGERLFVVAGSVNGQSVANGTMDIWVASVDSRGRLDLWTAVPLDMYLAYKSVPAFAGGRLYVIAGGNLYSIDTSLPLESWSLEYVTNQYLFGNLSDARLVSFCDTLLMIRDEGRTYSAPLLVDGTLSEWRIASRFYDDSSGSGVAVSPNERVYVIGGRYGSGPARRIFNVWSTTRL